MTDPDVIPSLRPPIAVDLDGTLILSDTLHEEVIGLLRLSPAKVVGLAQSLRQGKAAVKRFVADHRDFDPALLPYDPELLAYLRAEHDAGRRIGLFTAADQSIADAVASHIGLFDVARGSDGVVNVSGATKADLIEAEFGPSFSYAGDGPVDLPIFARAQTVILAGPAARLQARLRPGVEVEATFPRQKASPALWARALRLHHWSKNSLVFVAPVLALPSVWDALPAALLFVLMGLIASGTYLLNDLMDLAADRQHPLKRNRPFAAGTIPVWQGLGAAALTVGGALLASLVLLPRFCTLALLAYLVITLLYSIRLKLVPMVDVTVLAGLFTLRVLAGAMLVPTPVSPWLLTFSMMFFLGLAAIKRYAELDRLARGPGQGRARGYSPLDMPILLATGVSTGISAIVIFMIYVISEYYPRAVYTNPAALWGIMPVLLVWTLRLWHLAVHGRMSEDPVVFALKDRLSLALGGVILLIIAVARL